MKLSKLFAGCDIDYRGGDLEVGGISSDSRKIKSGDVFICIKGEHRDGHDFAIEAQEKKAALIVSEVNIEGIENIAITPNTRLAESVMWYNFTERPCDGMTKIAVTGTAGKTSTVFILRHILRAAGKKVGVITTVRSYAGDDEIDMGKNGGSSVSDIAGAMTTPDPEFFFGAALEMKKKGCDTLIYEASSQGLLLDKTSAIKNDIAVFTNLSPEHLDCHGTMENYFAAKAKIMKYSDCAVVNIDDPWIARLPGMFPDKEFIKVSADPAKIGGSDVCTLRFVPHGADGIEYVYFSEKAVFRIKTPLIGRYSVYNTLEAAACTMNLGVGAMTVKEALFGMRGIDGRLSKVKTDAAPFNVFIDYAHTPESLKAALTALREIAEGRLTVLFGCGGDRDRGKRSKMAETASKYADFVVITSDNPRSEDPMKIIGDIEEGIDKTKKYEVIPDRREALRYVIKTAEKGDTILLAGKGHEKYEITSSGKFPFDEEAIVTEETERIYKK